MGHEEKALRLVERIYEAIAEPELWNVFLKELSEALGGAAIQLSMRLPETVPSADSSFRVGLDAAYYPAFLKHALEGLPWGSLDEQTFRGRFGLASELVPDDSVEDTVFYRDYMKPQGLAPEWPICHVISTEQRRPLAGMAIYRREGSRPLDADDLRLLNALVPHLARAYAIQLRLSEGRQEREVLTEVIDRMPVGVIFLDAEGKSLLMNRSAQEILAFDDGFRLDQGRPSAENRRENRALQGLIGAAVKTEAHHASSAGGVMSVRRPSGRRAFPLMVGPLLAASPDSSTNEARAIIFVGNPDAGQIGTTEVLETLYQLTHAEAELVRLIAEGRSLEQVARERGVTMNTVRSQLKQVFSKTDTSRQGELVHLVLTGIASIRDREGE